MSSKKKMVRAKSREVLPTRTVPPMRWRDGLRDEQAAQMVVYLTAFSAPLKFAGLGQALLTR
jgi:hypothetical protein